MTPSLVRIDANIVWTVELDPKSRFWVACCDTLSVTASAPIYRELVAEISAVLHEMMVVYLDEGELESLVASLGGQIEVVAPADAWRFDVRFDLHRATTLPTRT